MSSIARQQTTSTRTETAPRPDARATEEQIRLKAYQLFQSRQREGVSGDPVSDWTRAEQELRTRPR